MSKLLIKNGTVVNADGTKRADVLIKDGKIVKIAQNIADGCEVFDATGKYLFPAFVDMHVHLREPGYEYKEDIESGSKAAVKGGYCAIACMPNTLPVADNAAVIGYIKARGKEVGLVDVLPIGAISKDLKGEQLAEIGKMTEAGAVAFSDDGQPVSNARIMRLAMEYADGFGKRLFSHCEDKNLSDGGYVNEGFVSTMTGLKGIPRAAEEVMVAREILLAESLDKSVHICHVSTKGSIESVRSAKARGVKVTCETCPHYFSATDELTLSFSAMTKVNPPLREQFDVEAVIAGLADGTIDAIATDHAPHHVDEKNIEYALAAFGISGLETAFGLAYTKLVAERGFSLERLVELTSLSPAKLLGIEGGVIAEGKTANITVCDLDKNWIVDSKSFFSKGKNTPFDQWRLKGKVTATVYKGRLVYKDGALV